MQTLTLPIGQIRLNDDNPRLIKDARFAQLVKSLQEFPEMLALRPLVVDESYTVLGGNMRLRAMLHLHYTEALVTVAEGLSEAQKREFVIKDNGSFGEHDWDALANSWADLPLEAWGIDVPVNWLEGEPDLEDLLADSEAKPATMKITFTAPEQLQQAEQDIQELLDRKYQGAYFSVSAGGI